MALGGVGEDEGTVLGGDGGGEEVHEDEVEDRSDDEGGEDEVELVEAEVGAGGHVAEDAGGDADELLHEDLEGELGVGGDARSPAVDEGADDRDIGRLGSAGVFVVVVVSTSPEAFSVVGRVGGREGDGGGGGSGSKEVERWGGREMGGGRKARGRTGNIGVLEG